MIDLWQIACVYSGFAQQLAPLSLFESGGPSVDQALQSLLDWLTQQAAPSQASEQALQILCQMVAARGTLSAIMSLCRFFVAHPERLAAQPALLKILDTLFEPSEFEPSARELFSEPAPGSIDQLLQCWQAEIFPHVRAQAISIAA